MKPKTLAIVAALIAPLLLCPGARAAYPDRPIKLVVASPAGSPPDVMARLVSDKMAALLGQPVVVDNRPGAGGTIGSKSVATAEPDGYTILMGSTSNLLIAPAAYKNAGYDAGSFIPIARVADTSEVLAVHPSVPAKTVAEFVALAKSKPGTLNFASAGNGTLPHIEGELLKASAKIEISHVPYRGGGNALTGLVAGQVQMMFSVLTQMLPYIREGRLRGLATASATRHKLAPEIPTMVESGFPDFVTTSVTAIVAPPGTPPDVRRKLAEAVNGALASDDVRQSLAKLGGEARPSTPEELAAFLAAQQKHWAGIVKAARLSAE
jgi:tripartite-type tricarboxylate transporter receptor subunit TctC